MKTKLDNILVGMITGLMGAMVGFILLAVFWSITNGTSLSHFVNNIASKTLLYRDSILTVSTLFNVLIFYVGLKMEMWKFCRGMMMIIIASVPLIILFQMQAGIS
jgi:hypothetical protein